VGLLDRLVEFFVRMNGYSLVVGLSVSSDDVGTAAGVVLRDTSSTAAGRYSF
jgi:hypothetical protein